MCTTYIYVYAYLYLNALIYCGVLSSYYTISCFACNYYDTSSPHDAMHSSSCSAHAVISPTLQCVCMVIMGLNPVDMINIIIRFEGIEEIQAADVTQDTVESSEERGR